MRTIKKLVGVVIPVYKTEPNENELISLKRCLDILGNYPIILIVPNSLNIQWYIDFCAKEDVLISVEKFDDGYFANIDGYNKLLLSHLFYKRFLTYKYILIYQLDAFVFKDELSYWCKQGYDYIGAPWPKNEWPHLRTVYAWLPKGVRWLYKKKIKKLNLVGNGGFSLRRTKKFYLLCMLLDTYIVKWISIRAQEDMFWSFFAPVLYPFYKVGPENIAMKFAFEIGAKRLFQLNNHILPFGCHAWEKYDTEFWLSEFTKLDN